MHELRKRECAIFRLEPVDKTSTSIIYKFTPNKITDPSIDLINRLMEKNILAICMLKN